MDSWVSGGKVDKNPAAGNQNGHASWHRIGGIVAGQ